MGFDIINQVGDRYLNESRYEMGIFPQTFDESELIAQVRQRWCGAFSKCARRLLVLTRWVYTMYLTKLDILYGKCARMAPVIMRWVYT